MFYLGISDTNIERRSIAGFRDWKIGRETQRLVINDRFFSGQYYYTTARTCGTCLYRYFYSTCKGKGKVFPYSLPSVGPGADPGVQAVSPAGDVK